MRKQYNDICNKYAEKFADKHELIFEGWVADNVGEVAMMGDYYVDFRDVKYDLDNNIDAEEYIKYYDYCTEVALLNMTTMNYKSWCKGCPRIPQEVLDKIQGLRVELSKLINETQEKYHGN